MFNFYILLPFFFINLVTVFEKANLVQEESRIVYKIIINIASHFIYTKQN